MPQKQLCAKCATCIHCCLCLERHPLQVSHKHDQGQRFILLLSQAAILLQSDTGSDGVMPAPGA